MRTKIITLSVVLGLCVPGVAVAATPTQDTYGGQLGQVSGVSNGGGPSSGGPGPSNAVGPSNAASPSPSARLAANTSTPSSGTSSSTGTLPFTGLDVGVVAAIGLGLAGLGFATRRATRTVGDVRS